MYFSIRHLFIEKAVPYYTSGSLSFLSKNCKINGNISKRNEMMLNLLDKIPYTILIPVAIVMLLAPFHPMPHVLEKLHMLKNGVLKKPIDIFDLFFHVFPFALLVLKIVRGCTK